MSHIRSLGLSALSAALLSGCVVQPNGQVQPIPPQPVYSQPQTSGPLRIAGAWALVERGEVVRDITVRRTRGGILITNRRGREFFAERIAYGAFRDERGRVYQFTNDVEGVFDNPNNGRRMRLRRLQ